MSASRAFLTGGGDRGVEARRADVGSDGQETGDPAQYPHTIGTRVPPA